MTMKKYFLAGLATLGLAGCTSLRQTADAALNPPPAFFDAFKALFQYLGSLVSPFLEGLLRGLFG